MLIPSSGDKHEDKLKDVGPDDGLDAADRGVEDADDEQGDASTVHIESGDLPWKLCFEKMFLSNKKEKNDKVDQSYELHIIDITCSNARAGR